MKIPAEAALLAVDIQNGFIAEADELPVPDGALVIPVINRLLPRFAVRAATQDWHPANHGSFASNHPGAAAFSVGVLGGVPQVFWPDHCVQRTRGAAFHPDFDDRAIQAIFRKGTDPAVDSYSAFNDNAGLNPTGLEGYLRGRGIGHLFVAGLALDYCVLYTARDARRLMPDMPVTVILDACRPVDPRAAAGAVAEMRALGVGFVESRDLQP